MKTHIYSCVVSWHVKIDSYYGDSSDNDGGGDVEDDSNDNLGACLLSVLKGEVLTEYLNVPASFLIF